MSVELSMTSNIYRYTSRSYTLVGRNLCGRAKNKIWLLRRVEEKCRVMALSSCEIMRIRTFLSHFEVKVQFPVVLHRHNQVSQKSLVESFYNDRINW